MAGQANKDTGMVGAQAPDDVTDPATGLSPREKRAIRDSWALLSQHDGLLTHAIELFVILFREYPYMKAKFSFPSFEPAALRANRKAQGHALTVMYSVGSLVQNLDNGTQLVLLVEKLARMHLAKGMGASYFQDLTDMFPLYLKDRAGAAATPFIQQSWTKLLSVMTSIIAKTELLETH